MRRILVIFGVFGEREYAAYRVIDAAVGAAQVACRWCVGEGAPERRCAACKDTRWIWIGI
jgi:hypothetical protein